MRTILRCNLALILLVLVLALGRGSPGEAQPRPTGKKGAAGTSVESDVVYGHKAGLALTFDVYRPHNPSGAAVLFMNSGGFESGKFRQCRETGDGSWVLVPAESLLLQPEGFHYPPLVQFGFEDLLADGCTVFDIRHGSGSRFPVNEIVSDVRRAVRFIRLHADQFNIDPDRIGVWGVSSGGYLALMLGVASDNGEPAAADPVDRMSDRIAAAVAYYPGGYDMAEDAQRFPQMIAALPTLQVSADVLDSLSLRQYVSADDPPALVIYGTGDQPFIVEPSEAVVAALREKGVETKLVAIPDVGHEFRGPQGYDPAAGKRAMTELRTWFRIHLHVR